MDQDSGCFTMRRNSPRPVIKSLVEARLILLKKPYKRVMFKAKRLLFFALGIVALTLVLAGCSRPESVQHSSAYAAFSPEEGLRQQGYKVESFADRHGQNNPATGSASRSWQGVLVAEREEAKGCTVVAGCIRDALEKALGNKCRDELTLPSDGRPGQPLCGLLIYSKDGHHGEARVWLIPDESESRVSYVIFLREGDLKTGV